MKNLIKVLVILSFVNAAYSYCPSDTELETALGIKDKIFSEEENTNPIAKKMGDILTGKESIFIGGANYKITEGTDVFNSHSTTTNIVTNPDGTTSTTTTDKGQPFLGNITHVNSEYYTGDVDVFDMPILNLEHSKYYRSAKFQFSGKFGDSCKYKVVVSRYFCQSPNCSAAECSINDVIHLLYTQEDEGTLKFEAVS